LRRWFLARFYRLGLGSWFDPPTKYVDKAPTSTSAAGDDLESEVLEGDLVYTVSPLADGAQSATCASDALLGSSPVGVPQLRNEVDP
jgi:hypothetical protein